MSKALPGGTWSFWLQNQCPRFWGRPPAPLCWSDGQAQTQAVSLSVLAGSDRLALGRSAAIFVTLAQFESWKGLMLCKFGPRRQCFSNFFARENETPLISRKHLAQIYISKQQSSLGSVFRSIIGLWVKIWHGNKATCSESNPVQKSRSKSTTCPWKGSLLGFQSKRNTTSDACAQMIENNLWDDFDRSQQRFETLANERQCQKAKKIPALTGRASTLNLTWNVCLSNTQQSASQNDHALCYWHSCEWLFNINNSLRPLTMINSHSQINNSLRLSVVLENLS